ncbi:hypothetical protein, partial [Mycolicibacter senuensis]
AIGRVARLCCARCGFVVGWVLVAASPLLVVVFCIVLCCLVFRFPSVVGVAADRIALRAFMFPILHVSCGLPMPFGIAVVYQ